MLGDAKEEEEEEEKEEIYTDSSAFLKVGFPSIHWFFQITELVQLNRLYEI